MTFKDLNIIPSIMEGLSKANYTNPTPIQEQAIPAVLAGRICWDVHRQEQARQQHSRCRSFNY